MHRYLIILIASSVFIQILADLQDLNIAQEHLNPLNDPDITNTSSKDQDKRTIFNPTIRNYAWAKHVAIRPWGPKQVIGFGPVDLKYTPVLRPISLRHHAYHYDRPKIHFHLKKPVPVIHTGWKPIIPAVKPVHVHPEPVIVKPVHPVHVDHIHTVPHVDHVHVHREPHVHVPAPVAVPAPVHVPHVDHIHTVTHIDQVHAIPQPVPVQPVPIVPRPVAVPAPNVFEVTRPDLGVLPIGTVFSSPVLKEIPAPQFKPVVVPQPVHPVPHVQHFPVPQVHPVTHLHPVPDVPIPHIHPHLHPAPDAPFPHVHPHLHATPDAPFPHVHSHFHTVPDAPFPHVHPHLHPAPDAQIPHLHPHLHAVPEVHQIPTTHLHPAQPIPQPHFQQTVVPQPILPPGTSVEYHGSTNFLNLFREPAPAPVAPQVGIPQPHVHQVQPPAVLPNHFHLQYPQIPQSFHPQEPHDAQIPVTQPGFDNPFPSQQHPPINDQVNFQLNEQNGFRPNAPQPQEFPEPDQPRYQPADQVSAQHYFQGPQSVDQLAQQGYVYSKPEKSIQPGQTDIQFPIHLPQHPGFHQTQRAGEEDLEEARFSEERDARYTETVFKPSIQLEPPYKK